MKHITADGRIAIATLKDNTLYGMEGENEKVTQKVFMM